MHCTYFIVFVLCISSKYSLISAQPPPVQQFQQPPPPVQQQQFQQPPPPVQQQQFQQPPPPVQQQQQFQQPPPPVQQQPPPPVQQQQQFQQPPPPVQQQQFQQPPPPVQQQQFQQPPPPVQQQYQQPPPPVQQQQQFQQPPPPVQQQQFQQPPPPVQQQQQFQQPPPPVQQFQQPPPPVQQQQFQQPPPPVQQPPSTQPPIIKEESTTTHKPRVKPPPIRKPVEKAPNDADVIRLPSAERFKPDLDPSRHFVMITAVIPSGSRDCYFYQPITHFLVNYDVMRGGSLDIGISIIDPSGMEIIKRTPQSSDEIKVSVSTENRDLSYAICLDNRKASYDEKNVGLSISLDIDFQNPSEDEKLIVDGIRAFNQEDDEVRENLEKQIEHLDAIENQIDVVAQQLRRIMVHFTRLKHSGSLDKDMMAENHNRVQNWSLFQFVMMICIAYFQTYIIKGLFGDGSFTLFGLVSSRKVTSNNNPVSNVRA